MIGIIRHLFVSERNRAGVVAGGLFLLISACLIAAGCSPVAAARATGYADGPPFGAETAIEARQQQSESDYPGTTSIYPPPGSDRDRAARLASELASPSPTPPLTLSPAPQLTAAPPKFDAGKAMAHVKQLASVIGVRTAGTAGELRGANYIEMQLKRAGLKPAVAPFSIHGGRKSRNISVFIKGKTGADGRPLYGNRYMVLGAHIDTKAPAPGANDNGSGVGVLLELARVWKTSPPPVSVQLVFFGAEEIVDRNPDHHHYGSRALANKVKKGNGLIGMISVDDVGVGPDFHVRAMLKGPRDLWKQFLADRKAAGIWATFKKDPGWSDHEPFEKKGYPVAWIEFRPDSAGHTRNDNYKRIKKDHLDKTGKWVTTYFNTLTPADVAALTKASPK